MTEIKDGGLRELWKISSPMMVSFLSLVVMLFVDRLYLSWYSTEALTACVQAGTLAWGVIMGWITLASMSEVFASQYNGAKQYDKLGIPVWQMLWVTLASFAFYIPMAFIGSGLIYDPSTRPLEYEYFQMMMLCGPIFALNPALSGFFVGRGKTQILQWLSILGNGINIIVDPILIFGIDGIIPSMGPKGAAIATAIGTLIQGIILFFVFFQKKHRNSYGTRKFQINWEVLRKTIRVGISPAAFVVIEILGWALFYHFMMEISQMHIYVAGVVQSVVILFFFFGMGLEKGAIAITGNLIGAKRFEKVKRVLFSGIKLNLIYGAVAFIPLVLFPELVIKGFMGSADLVESSSDIIGIDLKLAVTYIKYGMFMSLFLIIFENMRWVLNGILTAAGDTFFLLIAGVINMWFFLIIPTYVFVVLPKASIETAFTIWAAYGFLSLFLLYFRYWQGKWKSRNLLGANEASKGPAGEISEKGVTMTPSNKDKNNSGKANINGSQFQSDQTT